jgi:two-component system, chemotaxis family, chemotaxis protein CheY
MKTVWIVDDDQEMTHAISMMLELLGCQVTGFLSARNAAQSLLTGVRPDVLFLDINMPEVSGLDFLEFLRRRPEWMDLPIVMLSTEAADVTVDQALELGADGYVMKPMTLEELDKVVETAFQKYQKQ